MIKFFLALVFSFFFLSLENLNTQNEFEFYYKKTKYYRNQGMEDSMLINGKIAINIAKNESNQAFIAKTNIALGNFYFHKNNCDTIAYKYYHEALIRYKNLNDSLKMAKTLLRLGIIEKNNRSFIKSKETCIKSLELIGNKSPGFLQEVCNNLGIIYNHTGELKKSLDFHNKSLELRRKSNIIELIIQSYNNIATAYKTHEDYKNAELYYNKGLNFPQEVLGKYPVEYARLLDNQAHLNLLQNEFTGVLSKMEKALHIREELNDKAGIVISFIHIAHYYQKINDYTNSIEFAKKALAIAKPAGNFRDALESLTILSENYRMKSESNEALKFTNQYNELYHEMYEREMSVYEKFADIRYQATQKEKENEELRIKNEEQEIKTERQKRYFYYTLGTLVIALLTGLLYFNSQQLKVKKKELITQQKEREAEKEIEKLLFEQQAFAEKSKQKEQERIAHDLHDSVAGKISGTLLQVDNLTLDKKFKSHNEVEKITSQLANILQELEDIVYDLNDNKITTFSFHQIIEQLIINQLPQQVDTNIKKSDSLNWDTISNQVKIAIYYIMQQAMRNIKEHAGATIVNIEFRQEPKNLHILISDNGIGIPEKINYGIGLKSMKNRTETLGGNFRIQSEHEMGTKIMLNFPL